MLTLMTVLLALAARAETPAPAPKQILHLSLRCRGAAPNNNRLMIGTYLKYRNAGANIRTVAMEWPCDGTFEEIDRAGTELRQKLSAELDQISHFDLLALDTPDNSPNQSTMVLPLGQLEQDGLDQSLRETLMPLQNRAAPNAKILMLAGMGLTGADEVAGARAKHLLDFVGATRGSVAGLEQPKLFADVDIRKDLNLKLLLGSVVAGFNLMMWLQPQYTFARVLLSRGYWLGLSLAHQKVASMAAKTSVEEWYKQQSSTAKFVNSLTASVLGTVLAAVPVFSIASLSPEMLKTFAIGTAISVPIGILTSMYVRMKPYIKGTGKNLINGGRILTPRADGSVEVIKIHLEKDEKKVFGCDDLLSQPAVTEPTADAADRAA